MSRMIYIVMGWCGEYSDHEEWLVAAYPDEAVARQHAEKAKAWFLSNPPSNKYRGDSDWLKSNPYDPHMQTDYTGTDWTVGEVEMREELPQ